MKLLGKIMPWLIVFALIYIFIKLLSVGWFYYAVYIIIGTLSVGVTTLGLLAKRKK
jgi:acyl-coenzyme A synthetase/AMP-(fatty) acid ligase